MATLDDLLEQNKEANKLLEKVAGFLEKMQPPPKDDEDKGKGGGLGNLLKTVGKLTVALGGLLATAEFFAGALNPALVKALNIQLRNLSATVGVALEPIIANLIPIVMQLSGIFLDLARDAAPMLSELSEALGEGIIANVRLLAVGLQVLMAVLKPLVTLYSEAAKIQADLTETATALLKVLVDMAGAWLGQVNGVGDAMKQFRGVVYDTIAALARFAATLLVMAGGRKVVEDWAKELRKTIADRKDPKGGAVAAPTSSSTSGIEEIAKRFAERAFIAGGGVKPEERKVELLEKIARSLDDAAKDTRSFREWVKDEAVKARTATKAIVKAASHVVPGGPLAVDIADWILKGGLGGG